MAKKKGIEAKNRKSKYFYEDLLASENKKMLALYNSLYNHLHLSCGYDGETKVSIFKDGYKLATDLLKWLKIKLK